MHPFPARRLLTLLVIATALAGATPAAAAPTATIDLLVKDHTQAPGGTSDRLQAVLFADRPIAVRTVGLRFRLSGDVPGVHLQESMRPNNCRLMQPDDLTDLICTVPVDTISPDGSDSGVVGYVGADVTAVPGSVETMTVTLTVPGRAAVVRTAKIRIGQAADLTTEYDVPTATAEPGGPFDAALTVRNNGSGEIRGAAVYTDSQWSFESRARYSNCWYFEDRVTGCVFDETLAPQTDYRVTLPYRLRRDTYAPGDYYSGFLWMTRAEFDDLRSFVQRGGFTPLGTPGRGGVLRLEQAATARAADLPPADPDEDDSTAGMKVTATGVQGADLAAVGDRGSGKAGAVATVTIGVRNNGPATLDRTRGAGEIPAVVLAVPPGTTAVGVPRDCYPVDDTGRPDHGRPGAAGHPRYLCRLDSVIRAGRTSTMDFGLRIDRVLANARGTVGLTQFGSDLDRTNDTAAIVMNPVASEGAGGGAGGSGGLPITGPPGAAVGGIGVLLVVAGAVGFLAVRRRRIRFEA